MPTETLAQTLNTIRAEKLVRCATRTQEPLQTCVCVIAEAKWDSRLEPGDDTFLAEDVHALKYRIIDALDAQGLSHSHQWTYRWTGDPDEGLIEWTFGAR